MDAEVRAELAELRERAYGPEPDIAEDAVALTRLIELEDLARPALPEPALPPGIPSTGTPSPPAAISEARVVAVVPPTAAAKSERASWHVALIAIVAIVTIPLGMTAAVTAVSRTVPMSVAAPSAVASATPPDSDPTASPEDLARMKAALAFAQSPLTEVLIRVHVDGSFGSYVELRPNDDTPAFPVDGAMNWAQPLGDYYGWRLWIGGAPGPHGDESCLLLLGATTMRGGCVATEQKSQGALLVSVPFAGMAVDERPAGMTAEQSIGFWWNPDGIVTILLGPTSLVDG